MSGSQYLGQHARLRLLELGGRSPSYQNVWDDETENMRKRLLSGPTVDIRVGPERKHWSLHRNLLCHHSSYFETELRVDEKAETNGTKHHQLHLPHDDPLGFELLVKWLYQGQLEDASQMSDEAKYDYAVACHKLYLLCDRFDMIRLKDISMDQYRQCLNESQLVPDADEINDIYRASPVGSPFRSLMIRIAARQIMDPEVARDAEAYRKCFVNNPDFAIQMVNAIRSMSGGILFDDPTHGGECTYHDHDNVSGCQLEGKGKAKATKAGAVNGQGLSRISGGNSQNDDALRAPPAELTPARRTPRKLKGPGQVPSTAESTIASETAIIQPMSAGCLSTAALADSHHSPHAAKNGEKPATQANIRSTRVPSSAPPKLERRSLDGYRKAPSQRPLGITCNGVPPHHTPVRVASPFDSMDTAAEGQHGVRMRIPLTQGLVMQQGIKSPLNTRDSNQQTSIHVNDVVANPAIVSPSLGKENRPLSRANLAKADRLHATTSEHHNSVQSTARLSATAKHNRHMNGIRTIDGTDTDNGSTVSAQSRKRKMQDRTRRKARRNHSSALRAAPEADKTPNGVARPTLERSSTSHSSTISRTASGTASVASGPRKLSRVSSVVKVRNGNGGMTSIDGKRPGVMHSIPIGRQPPKLRLNSRQT